MAQTREESREYQKRYHQERRQYLKAHRICVRCGANDAEPGDTRCLVCKMDDRERNNERYRTNADYRKKGLARSTTQRRKRKEAGLCSKCGKNPAENGKTQCKSCSMMQKQYYKIRKKRKVTYKELGLCTQCGAERADGYKLCPDCLEKARKGMEHARAAAKKKRLENPNTHPWEQDNRAAFRKEEIRGSDT